MFLICVVTSTSNIPSFPLPSSESEAQLTTCQQARTGRDIDCPPLGVPIDSAPIPNTEFTVSRLLSKRIETGSRDVRSRMRRNGNVLSLVLAIPEVVGQQLLKIKLS